MAKIAVFGATFDPPHLGHADVIEQILSDFDTVLLVPSAAHAFGKQPIAFDHRFAMTRLLVSELFNDSDSITVTDIERKLAKKSTPVYSWDLLRELEANYLNDSLTLVLGPDNQEAWNKFHRHEDIDQQYDKRFVEQRVPVRSTLCRALPSNLDSYVGKSVADYIKKHELYVNNDKATTYYSS